VNAGYITRAKLLNGHLRDTQEKLSATILGASRVKAGSWPRLASRKIGDPVLDPTPPDPRSNAARVDRFMKYDAPRLLKSMTLANGGAAQGASITPIASDDHRPFETSSPAPARYRTSRY
jgi:hypothetical protein